MAKLYGEIAAKSLLTLDKSFARANGQPLDASEVYYSLDAAKAYAATAQAYIGQKIVVIENGVVSHYSVDDEAGNLKELGSKPVADGTTVAIGEDGKITLANITEAEATGTYNAVLVNGALTWVKPSSTTVEGLSDLITALTGRVNTAEADIDALQAAVGVAAKDAVGEEGSEGYEPAVAATGLHKAIADEAARAKAAEEALGERIDGIDFVDNNELTAALEPYAKSADVVAKTDYATDKKALEDEDAAIRAIAEGARDSINTFLNSEEIDETVNTLKEIQAEIEKMTDATELATALSSKADKTYVDEELAKKQDVIAEGTYATPGDVATAKSEAITEAANAAAGIYTTSERVDGIEDRVEVLEAIDHTLYATKEEFTAHETAADKKYATKEELAPVTQTANNASTAVTNLEARFDEIVAVGGEPNAINKVQVNGSELAITDKTVNITVPTKVSDLTDDTGFDARITAAQSAADAAQGTANEAKQKAEQAQSEVDALETVVGNINTTVSGHGTTLTDYGTRIGALEQADITHATEYSELKGVVTGHTEAIAKKAEQTALDATNAKVATNETAIQTINETTIPGINTEIAKKANAADVYTKTEIGTPDEGKTVVQMIKDAQTNATYDDTEVRGLIKDNADAIDVLNGTVDTTGSVLYVAKAQAELAARNEVSGLVGAAPDALDTLEEIAKWIAEDETGTTALVDRVIANENAVAAINNETTGILATAKGYTDTAIAGLPAATAEALGLVKYDNSTIKMNDSQQLYVAQVSTDVLVNGSEILVLNGGKATDQ